METKVLRIAEVKSLTGLSKMTIYRLGKAGVFPKKLKLTNKAVGWLEVDVVAWIQGRKTR